MIHWYSLAGSWIKQFLRQDKGTTTIEFVIVFPVFFLMFSFSIESGLLATRQVMLDHGLDRTVRDVRIGIVTDTSHENLIDVICEYATIIPDCSNQLRLQMFAGDIDGWDGTDLEVEYECRDRSEDESEPLTTFTNTGSNNELMFLRACALYDPMLLYVGLGEALTEGNGAELGDAYALVATSGYVMEPFQ